MIPHFTGNVPFVDSKKMKEIDQVLTRDYNLHTGMRVENAGLNAAILVKSFFKKAKPAEVKILVVAGTGCNGACAMVAARRLKGWGFSVQILLAGPRSKQRKVTREQFQVLEKLNIPVVNDMAEADLVIDGIFGYGLEGDPKKPVARIIRQINESKIPVVSIDAPSGLDLSTGKPAEPTIKAKYTMALAVPKTGLFKMAASKHTGELYLADISIPSMILESSGIKTNGLSRAFHEGTVVKINKVVVFNS